MRARALLFAIAFAFTLAAPAGAAKAKTTTHRDRKAPLGAAAETAQAGANLSAAWEVPVADTPAPYVAGAATGFVIVTRTGRVAMHAGGSSEPLWQVELGSPALSPPVVRGQQAAVVAAAGDGTEVILLDLTSGRIVSRLPGGALPPLLSAAEAGLSAADPTPGSASLSLIDPETGSPRWKAPLEAPPSTPASQCGDLLVVGCTGGLLIAVSSADGSPRWKESIGETITTPLLCSGHRGWVGSADNRLHALTVRKHGCHRRWSFLTGGDIAGRIVLFGSRVLFSSFDTYLYALEAGNGHLAWKVHLGRRPQSETVLIGDLLMVAPLNTERMEVFHLPDGTQKAALALATGKDRFVTPPAKAGDLIVIGAARYGEETARIVGVDPKTVK